MTSETGVTILIERGLDMTGAIVAGITTTQWSASTPCPNWNVRDVLNHLVGGMRVFAGELTGNRETDSPGRDWLGQEPARAFQATGSAGRAAWGRPDALTGIVTISLGQIPGPMAAVVHFTEVVVHGVDLAVATGQLDMIDEPLCQQLLDMMEDMGGVDAFRVPGLFGQQVDTDTAAPAHQCLAGFLGRTLQPTVIARARR